MKPTRVRAMKRKKWKRPPVRLMTKRQRCSAVGEQQLQRTMQLACYKWHTSNGTRIGCKCTRFDSFKRESSSASGASFRLHVAACQAKGAVGQTFHKTGMPRGLNQCRKTKILWIQSEIVRERHRAEIVTRRHTACARARQSNGAPKRT